MEKVEIADKENKTFIEMDFRGKTIKGHFDNIPCKMKTEDYVLTICETCHDWFLAKTEKEIFCSLSCFK